MITHSSIDLKSGQEQEHTSPKREVNEDIKETLGLLRYRLTDSYYNFIDNVKEAWVEMTGEEKESQLSRKVDQAASYRKPKKAAEGEGEDPSAETNDDAGTYSGPSAIVHVKEPKGAWESMKDRLSDSPLIQELLKNSRKFTKVASDTPIAKQASEQISKVKEFWETSQNPIVYAVSGMVDNMTAETEQAIAMREIQKLDPKFDKEEWAAEVLKTVVPVIIGAQIRGDTKPLKPWLKEAVYNKLSSEIRLRKQDGIVIDPRILDIEENDTTLRYIEPDGALILGMYEVQQIHLVKNTKGEILEGSETDVRKKYYHIVFQLTYNDEESVAEWKVADYALVHVAAFY